METTIISTKVVNVAIVTFIERSFTLIKDGGLAGNIYLPLKKRFIREFNAGYLLNTSKKYHCIGLT